MKRGPTRHHPTENPTDPGWCTTCNLPATNAIHDVPPVSEEQKAYEARKVGGVAGDEREDPWHGYEP
jgi:hypothetical protein